MKKLTIAEAKQHIGLEQIDSSTYRFQNVYVKLAPNGLLIKILNKGDYRIIAEDEYLTMYPYSFSADNSTYTFQNKGGFLSIFVEEK